MGCNCGQRKVDPIQAQQAAEARREARAKARADVARISAANHAAERRQREARLSASRR
jgi:hypothetical protein